VKLPDSEFDNLSKLKEEVVAKCKGKQDSLSLRKTIYTDLFSATYGALKQSIAKQVLFSTNANDICLTHTRWFDDWMKFTWWFVTAEQSLLLKDVILSSKQKLPYLERTIPRKQKKQSELTKLLTGQDDQSVRMDPAERAYYSNQLKDLEKEIGELLQELKLLEKVSGVDNHTAIDQNRLLEILLIFARGGYGRSELTFSSDIDLGYCLDHHKATSLEILTLQELIKRMEDLFQGIPLDLASQYFELGEDLSRFSRMDMLHTIPSILEGRVILGNPAIMKTLKQEFLQVCPPEKAIRFLKQQMDNLALEGNDTFRIKEGFGGIRHLQYVLWMVLIVDNSENSNSGFLLDFLNKKEWITANDRKNLLQALEFYFDLRNFIGLFENYRDTLSRVDFDGVLSGKPIQKDYLDNTVTMAYLKLKQRFITVDYMDRFRLNSVRIVAALAQSIVRDMLNRTVTENLMGFSLIKHLGSNTIVRFLPQEKSKKSAWNLNEIAEERRKSKEDIQQESLKQLFLNMDNLFKLFLYIGKTGNKLSDHLLDSFSALVEEMYKTIRLESIPQTKKFVMDLFIAENASVSIQQMLDISAPMSRDGHIMTLLGLFLPEANQMRFLLRNLDVHEYPLCIHSLKALHQVEIEIETSQKNEPELWRFTDQKDIFALKWATFFHDIGKINPYRNHEKLGPVLSTDMLRRLGWSEQDEVIDLVRLLIANHQSVVRFSQLSTYLDLGILKFFELAQRDPRKVLLLYLINLSDFKSVNAEMSRKAAHLESFFEKTMSILGEFRREELSGSLTEIVNNYLDRTISEKRTSVLLELLLRQCCNRNLEDVIINPLSRMSPQEAEKLQTYRDELENSLAFLKLAELDAAALAKHRFKFTQVIQQVISEPNVFAIVAPLSKSWNWFFTTIPNRYLLSSTVEVLTSQLQEFEGSLGKKISLSYVKGDKGEYDSILFHFVGDALVQTKIAYALSWQGINIENGKINKVKYARGEEGYMGYFRISTGDKRERLSSTELEHVIDNLIIPPLTPPPISTKRKMLNVQVQYFLEKEKGYQVWEVSKDQYKRLPEKYVAVKISLFDAPFVYYKIMRSFEAIGVVPQQVTITTIGNQIIDYFYITREARKRIRDDEFKGVLHKYINAEIKVD
jgi:UTP:GlnB (protein PII) uridylyltransferase